MPSLAKTLTAKQQTLLAEVAANEGVRTMLMAQGDDGHAIRHVRHYAYPKTNDPAVRTALITELRTRGFQVSNSEVEDGLIMEHHRSVAGDDFDQFTAELRDWFAESGWDYDGWECAIVMAAN